MNLVVCVAVLLLDDDVLGEGLVLEEFNTLYVAFAKAKLMQ